MENVRKWATIAEGAIDTNRRHKYNNTGHSKQLTTMSITTLKPAPPQERCSQSPAPNVRFDNRECDRRSPTPDENQSHPQGTYWQNALQIYNRIYDRYPSSNNQSTFNLRPKSPYPAYNTPTFQPLNQWLPYQQGPPLNYRQSNTQRMIFMHDQRPTRHHMFS